MGSAGEYPITLKDASREFHLSDISSKTGVSKPVELGKKTGLYNLVIGEGQSFFSGNGWLITSGMDTC